MCGAALGQPEHYGSTIMRKLILAAFLATSALPASALTVHTSQFIFGGGTNFTSFENLGYVTAGDGVNSYSEDGIDVAYVGTGAIWSQSQPTPDGVYSWYPDGGGSGYTSFTFDDVSGFQLLVGSGFFNEGLTISWEVLLDGALVNTGSLDNYAPSYGNGWAYFGFSDALFDEVHLQVRSGSGPFDAGAFEAGAYDAVTLTNAIPGGVPEPASWALMIAGFGLVGAAARRRKPVAC